MKVAILTFYVLVWPVLSALVLAMLARGVWKDIKAAKQEGEHLV